VKVNPGTASLVKFNKEEKGEWIRVTQDRGAVSTVHFCYNDIELRSPSPDPIFRGLAGAWQEDDVLGGLLYGLGNEQRSLGMAAASFESTGMEQTGYYELNKEMQLVPVNNPENHQFILDKFQIPKQVVSVEASSVLVVDDQERRWRLPLGMNDFTRLTDSSLLRISREVATERDLLSCHGTFYELPAENADGFAKIRPISSHPYRIHDYASYRGLLVMTGIEPGQVMGNPHIFSSDDGKAAVWAGVIDDLWKLGKPQGRGGPWFNTPVSPGQTSDPYLIGFYDIKTLELSHSSFLPVSFRIEVDPVGNGPWMNYMTVVVPPGESYVHLFPEHFQARWIRFRSEQETIATAWLEYK